MGLKEDEILKATKPAFGGVKAPRQWFESADAFLTHELAFVSHPLDRCVYLFERDGGQWIVDGTLGLHVDGFIGAGEGIKYLRDLSKDPSGACEQFQHRLHHLSSSPVI